MPRLINSPAPMVPPSSVMKPGRLTVNRAPGAASGSFFSESSARDNVPTLREQPLTDPLAVEVRGQLVEEEGELLGDVHPHEELLHEIRGSVPEREYDVEDVP